MSFFSALVKVSVEIIKLPVAVIKDVACSIGDATEPYGDCVGHRTKEKLDDIKTSVNKSTIGSFTSLIFFRK